VSHTSQASHRTIPRLGISLGDPAGVGPEVVALSLAARPELATVVFGDRGVLARAARTTGVDLAALSRLTIVPVTDIAAEVDPGRPNLASARAQVAYLAAATRAVAAGEVAALVTAPISKEWAARAGFAFPGHTEYLAAESRAPEFAMMLAASRLRVTVVTGHLALREVPTTLTAARIASTVVLTATALQRDFGILAPRVAVAGLNPHAGEAGRFGDEEARLVVPGIEQARARLAAAGVSAEVSGPHVPDVVFRQAACEQAHDGVVALYHDQGLIPIKLLAFDEAVNVTLGLNFLRTSPDHGTAYDIAGTGRARPQSFMAALDLAAEMAARRAAGSPARPLP
jgi:4-hydroxythreonine-4-phosphate dehydrogenase